MTLAGPFRQHWSTTGEDRESKVLNFEPTTTGGPASRQINQNIIGIIGTEKGIFTAQNNDNEMTFSVWIYPILGNETFESDERFQNSWPNVSDYAGSTPHRIISQYDGFDGDEEEKTFVAIDSNGYDGGQQGLQGTATGKVLFRFMNISVTHSVNTINYGQWNHILISMKRSGNNTANDQIDFAINGLNYSNQFASNHTRFLPSSAITSHSTSNTLIDNDVLDQSTLGAFWAGINDHPSQDTGAGFTQNSHASRAYNGHMYQMYFDNKYYDLTTYSNVTLFNSTAKRNNAALPSRGTKPLVLITDFNDFNSGSNDPGTVSPREQVSTSTLSKP